MLEKLKELSFRLKQGILNLLNEENYYVLKHQVITHIKL